MKKNELGALKEWEEEAAAAAAAARKRKENDSIHIQWNARDEALGKNTKT